jgi:ribosomal protein L35
MHDKAGRSHLRIKKGNNLRADSYGKELHSTERRKIKALLPYTA